MAIAQFRRVLDRGFFQHRMHPACPSLTLHILTDRLEHMDDLLLHHRRWPLLVAGVALRLARLLPRRMLRRLDRAHRRRLPHLFPRRRTLQLRHLGRALVRLQPRRHGLCLVRRSGLDRRRVRQSDDPRHLAFVQESRKAQHVWHKRHGVYEFLPVLAGVASCHLVPGA